MQFLSNVDDQKLILFFERLVATLFSWTVLKQTFVLNHRFILFVINVLSKTILTLIKPNQREVQRIFQVIKSALDPWDWIRIAAFT